MGCSDRTTTTPRFLALGTTGEWERRIRGSKVLDASGGRVWVYFERSDSQLDHAGDGKGRARSASPDVLAIPHAPFPDSWIADLSNNLGDFLSLTVRAAHVDRVAAAFISEYLPKVMHPADLTATAPFLQSICEKMLCTPSLQPLLCAPLLEPQCVMCGKLNPTSCSRCMRVVYCSKDCQRAHWPVHKLSCGM